MIAKEFDALKKLTLTLVAFLAIVICLDFVFGKVILNYIQYRHIDTHSGLEYAIKSKADVLIFGASQTEVGCNSRLISKLTSYQTVSLSQSASNCTYSYIILKEYLKHYKPKYIILGTSVNELYDNDKVLIETTNLRHLYGTDDAIDSILNAVIPHARLSLFFKLYRYNRLVLDILKNKSVDSAVDKFRPYPPDNGKTISAIIANFKKDPSAQPKGISSNQAANIPDTSSISYQSFSNFLDLCQQNQIHVIVFYGPYYKNEALKIDVAPLPDYFKTMPVNDFVSFYDLTDSKYSVFKNKDIFHDISHLNSLGADSLSVIISDIILKKSVKRN